MFHSSFLSKGLWGTLPNLIHLCPPWGGFGITYPKPIRVVGRSGWTTHRTIILAVTGSSLG